MSFFSLNVLSKYLREHPSLEEKYKRRDIYGNYFDYNDRLVTSDGTDPDIVEFERFLYQNYSDEVLFEIKFGLREVHQSMKVNVMKW